MTKRFTSSISVLEAAMWILMIQSLLKAGKRDKDDDIRNFTRNTTGWP